MKFRTILALGLLVGALAPLGAQNTITVSGSSKLVFPITGVRIVFSVSSEALEITAAHGSLQQKLGSLLADLKQKFGAKNDDLVQLAFSIDRKYDYVNSTQTFRGYAAATKFSYAHSLLDRQGDIVASLTKNGVTSIDKVELVAGTDKAVVAKAYSEAFDDAVFRAKAILKTSGATLGKVVRVAEAGGSSPSVTLLGRGFNPEGPSGLEGQTPPAYKDLSNLVGAMSTDQIVISVTFEVKN